MWIKFVGWLLVVGCCELQLAGNQPAATNNQQTNSQQPTHDNQQTTRHSQFALQSF
jgi:hypothetical protein